MSKKENNYCSMLLKTDKKGTPPSKSSKDKDEKRAAKWQNNQRNAKKKGTLSEERSKELEAIPGWTWSSR